MRNWLSATIALLTLPTFLAAQDANNVKPLKHTTSWVGNSFGGDGGPNGQGFWIQNGADEIEVTPDGTVFAGVSWDEAGRCAGLYKDGKVNRLLLKEHDGKGKETAWGFGTANNAVAASGDLLFVANLGKKLMRFRWKPGDLESVHFVDEVDLEMEAVGLTAKGDRLAVVYPKTIELYNTSDLKRFGRFTVPDARDAAFGPDGNLWVLAAAGVRRYSPSGREWSSLIPGLGKPTAIAFDPKGQLVVCDDGPNQQVKFFDVSTEPKLISTFGDEGGLLSGIPGKADPKKLFSLRGAGVDASGNLYVAMGFGGAPVGNLVLRSFDPSGKLRWEAISTAFVDTFGFDPASDGASVYGRTAIYDLDLAKTVPGSEWNLKAVSFDHLANPDDERMKAGCSVLIRNLQGQRLMATIGQYGGGYRFFRFDGPDGLIAKPAGKLGAEGETWAWDLDAEGAVWHGDAANRTIRRFVFKGWLADGSPRYDRDHPESWKWPEGVGAVRRVLHEKSTDSLYVFGYREGQEVDSWGVIGKTAWRFDGWLAGKPSLKWTINTPMNPTGSDKGTPLSPESVSLAGDYLFIGMVKPENGKQFTHVYAILDGSYVGTLIPGPEVGGNAGWLDMPYAVQALKRKNGEYLVLVEEDFRGKNLLYRWRPDAGK